MGFAQGIRPATAELAIQHNTMATLANTGVFVWQSTATNYVNVQMINNYMSGTQEVIDLGTNAAGSPNTGWVFIDNILATDLNFVHSCIDHAPNQSGRSSPVPAISGEGTSCDSIRSGRYVVYSVGIKRCRSWFRNYMVPQIPLLMAN